MFQDHDDGCECPDVFLDDERDGDGFEAWPDERWTLADRPADEPAH